MKGSEREKLHAYPCLTKSPIARLRMGEAAHPSVALLSCAQPRTAFLHSSESYATEPFTAHCQPTGLARNFILHPSSFRLTRGRKAALRRLRLGEGEHAGFIDADGVARASSLSFAFTLPLMTWNHAASRDDAVRDGFPGVQPHAINVRSW